MTPEEEEEREELYRLYSSKMLDAIQADVSPLELDRPTPDPDFALPRAERNFEQGQYLAQGLGDMPGMNTVDRNIVEKITPDEAEESGVIGQFVDFTSDFSLGLVTGGGSTGGGVSTDGAS